MHRGADLVAHVGQELGLGLGRRLGGGLGLAQGVLDALALGDVVNHPDEAPLARFAHLIDPQDHREGVAIPALRLKFPLDAQNVRDAGFAIAAQVVVVPLLVGRRHQHGHVPPDDLLSGITEHGLGAGVERFDQALGVDDEDGVLGGIEHPAQIRLAGGEAGVGLANAGRHRVKGASDIGQLVPAPDRHLVAQFAGGDLAGTFGEILELAGQIHTQRQGEQGHQPHFQQRQTDAVAPGVRFQFPQRLRRQPQFDPAKRGAALDDLPGGVEHPVGDRAKIRVGRESPGQGGFIAGGHQRPAVRVAHPRVDHPRIH
ncbi:MAG: hypothetical protein H6R24_588 [Proteobacteria bacterium]|nr:hypothetical protein [Pseudomonadota bacterium]